MTMKALCVLCALDGTRHSIPSRSSSGNGSQIDLQQNRARLRGHARPTRFSGATSRGDLKVQRRQSDAPAACYLVDMRIHS
jgi:hypothetical protein